MDDKVKLRHAKYLNKEGKTNPAKFIISSLINSLFSLYIPLCYNIYICLSYDLKDFSVSWENKVNFINKILSYTRYNSMQTYKPKGDFTGGMGACMRPKIFSVSDHEQLDWLSNNLVNSWEARIYMIINLSLSRCFLWKNEFEDANTIYYVHMH